MNQISSAVTATKKPGPRVKRRGAQRCSQRTQRIPLRALGEHSCVLCVDSHTLADAVILVAWEDQVLLLEAVGFADIAAQKPTKPDALFWIACQPNTDKSGLEEPPIGQLTYPLRDRKRGPSPADGDFPTARYRGG